MKRVFHNVEVCRVSGHCLLFCW